MEKVIEGFPLAIDALWEKKIGDDNREAVKRVQKLIWKVIARSGLHSGEPHSILSACHHLVYLYIKHFPDFNPNYLAVVVIKLVWTLLDQGQLPSFDMFFEDTLGQFYKRHLIKEHEFNLLKFPINKIYCYIQLEDMQGKELQLSLGRLMVNQLDEVDYDLINRLVARAKPFAAYTKEEYEREKERLGEYTPLS
jgi:hypothetical protein